MAASASAAASIIDTKGEVRVGNFNGSDDSWPIWCLRFEACTDLLGWGQFMETAATQPNEIDRTAMSPDSETVGRALYNMLLMKCEEKAFGIARLVQKGHGLEAWRRLKEE